MATKSSKPEPRKCPCDSQTCIDNWNLSVSGETEDDDDYQLQHCSCHYIAFGRSGSYCCLCQLWFCQNCTTILENDNDDYFWSWNETFCQPCKQDFLQKPMFFICCLRS